jgi:hypothetical protein
VADSNNASKASSGIGLGGIVFVVFLVLKLAEIGVVATWSWWWVTAPLWAPILVIGGPILVIGGIAWVIVSIKDGIRQRKRIRDFDKKQAERVLSHRGLR